MQNKSLFSADDRAKRPNPNARRSIGDLDTTYRTNSPMSPVRQERARQIAVRDVSGSMTDEEPVHAFMVPNKYLTPSSADRMPPKRPLGSNADKPATPQPVRMYSQVAAFDTPMPRVRRSRSVTPVAGMAGDSLTDKIKRHSALIAALAVAGTLFVWDKLKTAWQFVAHKTHALIIGPTRTTYGLMRGVTVRRFGIEQSRFHIVTPIALIILIFGIALFNTMVGERFHLPGLGGGSTTSTEQGSTVLQVTPGGKSASGTNSTNGANGAANNGAAQGANGTPQSAAQTGQSTGGAGSGLQSSTSSSLGSGSAGVGGLGGGGSTGGTASGGGSSGGGVSNPVTVPSTPVSVPSVPDVPGTPVTGGGGGSGGGSGGGGDCLCQTIDNTVNQVPQTLNQVTQPVTNLAQPAANSAGNAVNNVTQPVTSKVQQTTSGLGL
jgi:hypothetical protein